MLKRDKESAIPFFLPGIFFAETVKLKRDQSMLNRSNLHLNHSGDKALGKTLCAYLRSIRSGKTTYDSSKFF